MKHLLFIAILTIITSCKNHTKSSGNAKVTNEKTAKLDSLYTDLFNQNMFNGNVLIAEQGQIIFEKSFGVANEETRAKLNGETIFELASVSKQFTAMAIVQLVKDGKLNYDDDITKFIPELSFYKGITVENLLYHTSGLPDYMEVADAFWNKDSIATNEDIIAIFAKHKPELYFETNTDYEYCNTGYMLLASIIENVSGLAYNEFLEKRIFKPANMSKSFVYTRRYAPKRIDNIALGYLYSDSLKTKSLPENLPDYDFVRYLDGIVGDGMVNSTARDLYQWDRILNTEKLINNVDKKRMFQSYKFYDSIPTGYGYGWFIEEDEDYGKYVKHSGGWPGFVTHIERHLDSDKVIIVLQNVMMEKPRIPLKNTRKILYDQPL